MADTGEISADWTLWGFKTGSDLNVWLLSQRPRTIALRLLTARPLSPLAAASASTTLRVSTHR